MTPPSPDLCSVFRIPRSDNETIEAEITVSTENACFITPATVGTTYSFMGRAETIDNLIFMEYDVDVKLGDRIYDEVRLESWIVVAPPSKFRNPTDMTDDHQQIKIERQQIQ